MKMKLRYRVLFWIAKKLGWRSRLRERAQGIFDQCRREKRSWTEEEAGVIAAALMEDHP